MYNNNKRIFQKLTQQSTIALEKISGVESKISPNSIEEVVETIKNYADLHQQSLQWKNRRIMVVDDEEFCISAMKAMIKICGIDTNF